MAQHVKISWIQSTDVDHYCVYLKPGGTSIIPGTTPHDAKISKGDLGDLLSWSLGDVTPGQTRILVSKYSNATGYLTVFDLTKEIPAGQTGEFTVPSSERHPAGGIASVTAELETSPTNTASITVSYSPNAPAINVDNSPAQPGAVSSDSEPLKPSLITAEELTEPAQPTSITAVEVAAPAEPSLLQIYGQTEPTEWNTIYVTYNDPNSATGDFVTAVATGQPQPWDGTAAENNPINLALKGDWLSFVNNTSNPFWIMAKGIFVIGGSGEEQIRWNQLKLHVPAWGSGSMYLEEDITSGVEYVFSNTEPIWYPSTNQYNAPNTGWSEAGMTIDISQDQPFVLLAEGGDIAPNDPDEVFSFVGGHPQGDVHISGATPSNYDGTYTYQGTNQGKGYWKKSGTPDLYIYWNATQNRWNMSESPEAHGTPPTHTGLVDYTTDSGPPYPDYPWQATWGGLMIPSSNVGHTPALDNSSLSVALGLWDTDPAAAYATYGHISGWDTSGITDMSGLFQNNTTFNEDISGWDVSNVANMSNMFNGATSFNRDLSGWNTNSVTDHTGFDTGATSWLSANKPSWPTPNTLLVSALDLWNTDQAAAIAAHGHISTWDTSAVTDMSGLFQNNTTFNEDISGWDVSNVTNMSGMFEGATAFNQDLSAWGYDIVGVTNMSNMFKGATSFNGDVSTWHTYYVTNLSGMFEGATSFNQDVSYQTVTVDGQTYQSWDVRNVSTMSGMFKNATSFNQSINWPTMNVLHGSDTYMGSSEGCQDMSSMFEGATAFNGDISSWVIGKFIYEGYSQGLSWGGVRNMNRMFYGATSFNQDLGIWNPLHVTNMGEMFYGATSYNHDLSSWATGNVTEYSDFSTNATAWATDKPGFGNPDQITDLTFNPVANPGYQGAGGVSMAAAGLWFSNNSLCLSMYGTIEDWDTSAVTSMHGLFGSSQLSGMDSFNEDISNWNTSKVTDMKSMFYGTDVFDQDISTKQVTVGGKTYTAWDVSNVTNMEGMLKSSGNGSKHGTGVFNQDISNWDVSNVTNMKNMFLGCMLFNQPLDSWDVSNVTNMNQMFAEAWSFNQALNSWVTSSVTNMEAMFSGKHSWGVNQFNQMAFNGNISSWDTSAVTTMKDMFLRCTSFNQNVGAWDVSNVTNMHGMFETNYASSFNNGGSASIANWVTDNVTDMDSMFERGDAITFNISGWNVNNVTTHYSFHMAQYNTSWTTAMQPQWV